MVDDPDLVVDAPDAVAVGLVARLRERRVDGLEEGEGGIDAVGAKGERVEAGDRVRVEVCRLDRGDGLRAAAGDVERVRGPVEVDHVGLQDGLAPGDGGRGQPVEINLSAR